MATSFEQDSAGAWVIKKAPTAVLDYTVNWATWLVADTITGTPVWTVATGLTKDSQSNTTTTATAWLSGGTEGQDYAVSCRISTAAGRTDTRSFIIQVRAR